ncbi:MAG: hypothetical protein ACI8Z7_000784 [Candidatus Nanohaloarchaea archaeon]|jgi:hypothetical protein
MSSVNQTDLGYDERDELDLSGFEGFEADPYTVLAYSDALNQLSGPEDNLIALVEPSNESSLGELSQLLEEGASVIVDSEDYYEEGFLDNLPDNYSVAENLETYWGKVDDEGSKFYLISMD